MDVFWGTVAGVLPVIVGAIIGFALIRMGDRRRRATAPQPVTAPKCSCGHGLNYHDPETRSCHATVQGRFMNHYDPEGRSLGRANELLTCPCRQYIGPDILPSVWAQPTQLPQPTVNLDKD